MLQHVPSHAVRTVGWRNAVFQAPKAHPKAHSLRTLRSPSSRLITSYNRSRSTQQFISNSISRSIPQSRAYCDEPTEGRAASQSVASNEVVEPLRWTSQSVTPNLLRRDAIKDITRGVDVQEMLELAKSRIRQTLAYSFHMGPDCVEKFKVNDSGRILVVYDTHCLLSRILAQAYGSVLESAKTLMVDFEATSVAQLKSTIDTMKEGDMVVLVQSNGFRLNDYRLRIELFKVGIKNLEHAHLDMMPNSQIGTYIETLGFAPNKETLALAHGLKQLMDTEERFVIRSNGGAECVYECGMEPALLNIGDYTGMKGVGGTFPVGEVFSEPKDLDKVNGEFMVFGYPNRQFEMQHLCEPFKITISKGQLVHAHNPPNSFREILEAIRGTEAEEGGGILIREFGVGLNTAIGRNAPLQNVTAFERQAGFHISLGRKHTVFKKSGISHKRSRFHIDVFVDLDEIQMGNKIVFKNNCFLPL